VAYQDSLFRAPRITIPTRLQLTPRCPPCPALVNRAHHIRHYLAACVRTRTQLLGMHIHSALTLGSRIVFGLFRAATRAFSGPTHHRAFSVRSTTLCQTSSYVPGDGSGTTSRTLRASARHPGAFWQTRHTLPTVPPRYERPGRRAYRAGSFKTFVAATALHSTRASIGVITLWALLAAAMAPLRLASAWQATHCASSVRTMHGSRAYME